jgi:signal transduction histidine kinase
MEAKRLRKLVLGRLTVHRAMLRGLGLALLFAIAIVISKRNYLVFHTAGEMFCVLVAWSIFLTASSTHRFSNNTYFMFLGYAYLFIGSFDLLHTMAYPGMGIFSSGSPLNLTSQLWCTARTLESSSIFASTYFLNRTTSFRRVFFLYLLSFIIIMLMIFQWQVFPSCHDNGDSTPCRIICEYLNVSLLLASIIRLINKRELFPSRGIFFRIIGAYSANILAVIAFTHFFLPQSFVDFFGHSFKLVSYIFILEALVKANMLRPYEHLVIANQRLSREIAQREEAEAKRLRYEQELHKLTKLESIARVAGGLSHDFKNLLTIILGNADLARMRTDNERVQANLKHIVDAARQGAELANRLLTFARNGTGHKQPQDVRSLVQETIQLALSGSKIKASFCMPDTPLISQVDPDQLRQVLNNIVINAVQAMPWGGIISVSLSQEQIDNLPIAPGAYVVISIKDQGVGIKEEDMEKIFDPFFTTKEEGSGMGLATSFNIIKNHNGYITAASARGLGSIFTIFLPTYDPKALAAQEVAATQDSEE